MSDKVIHMDGGVFVPESLVADAPAPVLVEQLLTATSRVRVDDELAGLMVCLCFDVALRALADEEDAIHDAVTADRERDHELMMEAMQRALKECL